MVCFLVFIKDYCSVSCLLSYPCRRAAWGEGLTVERAHFKMCPEVGSEASLWRRIPLSFLMVLLHIDPVPF